MSKQALVNVTVLLFVLGVAAGTISVPPRQVVAGYVGTSEPVFVRGDQPLPADLAAGEALVKVFQPKAGTVCVACHRLDTDAWLVGPGLKHVAERAKARVPGTSAADHLRQSIIAPGAFVDEGYPDIMPKSFGAAFTDKRLDQIVLYLTSLNTR
jgi:cytochrome c551/c552